MELIIILFGTLFFVFLMNRISRLEKRVRENELQIEKLKKSSVSVEQISEVKKEIKPVVGTTAPSVELVKPKEIAGMTTHPVETFNEQPAFSAEETERLQVAREKQIAFQKAREEEKALRKRKWARWEKLLSENWTGVLGSAAMVLGVGFLGIYAALMMEAVFRFIMITALSVVLYGLFLYLKPKEKLSQLGYWLGSSSVAIFLFGCFGSGGIPGLQWIYNKEVALALLVFGILANFYFAWAAGTQLFTSLHAVLCLVPLAVVPNDQTLIVAAASTVGSLAFAYRYRWDRHVLIAVAGFFVFFIIWRMQSLDISLNSGITGVTASLAVGISAAFVHYRKDYCSDKLEYFPFGVHVLNWLCTGFSLLTLSTGQPWTTAPIVTATAAAFFLARYGRKKGIVWVYRTDTLLAQALAVFSFFSLNRWGVDNFSIAGLVAIESYLFAALMLRETDGLMTMIAIRIAQIATGAFVLISIIWTRIETEHNVLRNTVDIVAVVLGGLLYHRFIISKFGEDKDDVIGGEKNALSAIGLLLPLLSLSTFILFKTYSVAGIVSAVFLLIFMVARNLFRSNGLGAGILLTMSLQIFVLLAAVGMGELVLWNISALGSLFIASVIYVTLMHNRGITFLDRSSKALPAITLIGLLIGILIRIDMSGKTEIYIASAITCGVGVFGLIYHILTIRKTGESFELAAGKTEGNFFSPLGIVIGMVPIVLLAANHGEWWAMMGVSALLIVLLILRQLHQLNGLGAGLVLSLATALVFSWHKMLEHTKTELWFLLSQGLPVLAVLAVAYATSYIRCLNRSARPFLIYSATIHVLVVSYAIGMLYSPLIPGLAWLTVAVLAMEAGRSLSSTDSRENGQPGRYFFHTAYILTLFFLFQCVTVYLQVESYITGFKTRAWISILSCAVFVYWYFAPKKGDSPDYKSWSHLQPLFLELILLFAGVNIALDIGSAHYALLWILFSLVLFATGTIWPARFSRLRFYSLLFAWASGIYLAATTSTIESPSLIWFFQPWVSGTAALILQVVYLALIRKDDFFCSIEFPLTLTVLKGLVERITLRKNLWVHYPFFITTAIFLYWRFDSAILTLLWVIECFVIFSLSISLKVPQFRIVSLAALGVCLLRLVFFDMANTETIMRGIVFLGVGALMLGMNYLYRRFKMDE